MRNAITYLHRRLSHDDLVVRIFAGVSNRKIGTMNVVVTPSTIRASKTVIVINHHHHHDTTPIRLPNNCITCIQINNWRHDSFINNHPFVLRFYSRHIPFSIFTQTFNNRIFRINLNAMSWRHSSIFYLDSNFPRSILLLFFLKILYADIGSNLRNQRSLLKVERIMRLSKRAPCVTHGHHNERRAHHSSNGLNPNRCALSLKQFENVMVRGADPKQRQKPSEAHEPEQPVRSGRPGPKQPVHHFFGLLGCVGWGRVGCGLAGGGALFPALSPTLLRRSGGRSLCEGAME